MIPYVRQLEFEYGRCDQVSSLIRRVIADNPGPFTYLGTGTYIVGAGEVAVIDPGPDMPDHLAAILEATAGERVSHILVTHHHLDHSPLARPLAAATGAVIYGCAAPTTPAEGEVKLEAGYDQFTPDVSVCGGAVIEGAGWTIEAIPTPGHTSNHICYALARENALFSGDHIMGWSTTVITPPDGEMGDYLASLEKVKARRFATLWPTHGPPITEVTPFIEAYIEHRRERERQILSRLAAGDTRITAMVPVIYAAVDPRLHPAAAHSVLAHMIELVRSGRVRCDGSPGLDSNYRLAQQGAQGGNRP
jgi:glyoxylase-like metal-dependent hydrolase (beta-lactamase superfamily II)